MGGNMSGRGITMKNVFLALMFCVGSTLHAHGQEAGHCMQIGQRGDLYTVRNLCSSTVIAYYVATHPAQGDYTNGNAHVDSGETHETNLSVRGGIEVYACIFPHVPRNADGNTPHQPTNGYSCK